VLRVENALIETTVIADEGFLSDQVSLGRVCRDVEVFSRIARKNPVNLCRNPCS
jgi:hypothetical protein